MYRKKEREREGGVREREREIKKEKREKEREKREKRAQTRFFGLKIMIDLFLPKPRPNILPVSKARNYVPDLVGLRHFSEFQTPFSP